MPKKSVQKKGWKDVQSKKQIARKTRLAITVLAILIGLVILGKGVKFTQMLFTPWQQSQINQRNFSWNGDFNLNIIVRAKNVSLLSFNPQAQKVTLVDIPANTYLAVPKGFGYWELRSVYGLGESQKELGGDRLMVGTLTNFFALPIEGFLDFSGKFSQKEPEEIISEIKKNLFSLVSILPYLKTNLTPFELIRLKIGLSGVRFDKTKQINLADALQEEKLPDGTEVFTLDAIKIDSLLAGLSDPQIQLEHKTIAIFNSTDHPNLAQKAARLVTNIGGNVIITGNSQHNLKTTQVIGEKSKTYDRLKQIFGTSVTIDPKSEDLVLSRAQINIFLGEDYQI